jgi:hypothetical protein
MNSPVKTPWVKAIAVTPLDNHQLEVEFEDQKTVILDLGDLINRRDFYWRLKNRRYFNRVGIDPLGGICWPEGEDLAPDGLERYINQNL